MLGSKHQFYHFYVVCYNKAVKLVYAAQDIASSFELKFHKILNNFLLLGAQLCCNILSSVQFCNFLKVIHIIFEIFDFSIPMLPVIVMNYFSIGMFTY